MIRIEKENEGTEFEYGLTKQDSVETEMVRKEGEKVSEENEEKEREKKKKLLIMFVLQVECLR